MTTMLDKRLMGAGGGEPDAPTEDPDNAQSVVTGRLLYTLGEGTIRGLVNDHQSIYLDGTPLRNVDGSYNFNRVAVEYRSGLPNQAPIPGFSEVESEVSVGVEAKLNVPVVRAIGDANLDAIRVTLGFPGMLDQDDEGNIRGTEVRGRIELMPSGGSWSKVVDVVVACKTRSRYQKSYRFKLPAGGAPWQVRFVRTTPDSDRAGLSNASWWDSYTGIVEAKLRYPNTAMLGVGIDARQFSNVPKVEVELYGKSDVLVPSNYDPLTRAYAGLWDGSFKPAWTDNPVWIYYDLLTATRYGAGERIPPQLLDKWSLYQIAQYCDQLVDDGLGGQEPRFTCNIEIREQQDAYSLINSLVSVFRAMPYWAEGGITVVQDAPGAAVEAVFGPANVEAGQFSYAGSPRRERHTVANVRWTNPEDNYRSAIEQVEHPDALRLHGLRVLDLTAIACTSRGQAHRLGRWALYSEWNEQNIITFRAGMDAALIRPGDLLQVADPKRAGARLAGRLLQASAINVTLDAPVTLAAGVAYDLKCVLPDGRVQARAVVTPAGETDQLTLALPYDQVPLKAAMWVLQPANQQPAIYRLLGAAEVDKTRFELTAVEHYPGKFSLIETGLAFDAPDDNALPDPSVIEPLTGLAAVESSYLTADGRRRIRLEISCNFSANAYLRGYRFSIKPVNGNWTDLPESIGPNTEIDDLQPGDYVIRAVAVNRLGRKSLLVEITLSTQGYNQPAPPLAGLTALGEAMQIRLRWAWPAGRTDLREVQIEWTEDENATVYTGSLTIAYPTNEWVHGQRQVGVRTYYRARVVDSWGNVSAWAEAEADPIRDPSKLLDQLLGSIGTPALTPDLVGQIGRIEDIELIQLPQVEQAANDAALAGLEMLAKANEALDQLRRERLISDATVRIDPVTGEIQLIATVPVISDIEARITTVEINLDAKTGEISSISSTVSQQGTRLTAAESSITQLSNQIALKASQAYVDGAVAGALGEIDAQLTSTEQLTLGGLEHLLATNAARDVARKAGVVAAQATFDLKAVANAQEAEASARLALVALLDQQTALLVAEQVARATADQAQVSSITALQASTAQSIALINTTLTALATADQAATSRLDQQASQISGNTAAIQNEATTRANADIALSQSIQTVQASATAAGQSAATANAAIQTEQTARVQGDQANAQAIQTVQSTVSGQTSSIQTLTQAVDGIKAEWAVTVDANGKIAGIRLLSGASGTVFDILADAFRVSMPNGTGAKQVFVVGSINGSQAVGISGTLLVDGSITARLLSVDALQAIKASIDELVAVVIRDSSNANRLNFNAVGSQDVLSFGYGRARIQADGTAYFDGPVISRPMEIAAGTWSGNMDVYRREYVGSVETVTVAEASFYVDTGFEDPNLGFGLNANHAYTANAVAFDAWASSAGAAPYRIGVSAVVECTPMFYSGGNGDPSGRIYIRLTVRAFGSSLTGGALTIRVRGIRWKLYKVT